MGILKKTEDGGLWIENESAIYGRELYYLDTHSDDTPSLHLAKDIWPGSGSGFARDNDNVATLPDGQLVFYANESTYSNSVWVSGGNEWNTHPVEGLADAMQGMPQNFGIWSVGDQAMLFTSFYDHENPQSYSYELVAIGSDLSHTVTLLENISVSEVWGVHDQTLYFSGSAWDEETQTNRLALFTAADKNIVEEIDTFPEDAILLHWGETHAYFSAGGVETGLEPHALEFSTGKISLLKDIAPGTGASLAHTHSATPIGDQILFNAYISESETGIFISDGTTEGTHLLISADKPWLFIDNVYQIGDTIAFTNEASLYTFDLAAPESGLHTISDNVQSLRADSDQIFYSILDPEAVSYPDMPATLYSFTPGGESIEIARNVHQGRFEVVEEDAILFTTFIAAQPGSSFGSLELWFSDAAGETVKIAEIGDDSYYYSGNLDGTVDLGNAVAILTESLMGF